MKIKFLKSSIIATILAFAFATSAFACGDGGGDCTGMEYAQPAPTLTWGPTANVRLGAEGLTLGKALSGADGIGGEKVSNAWTFTEGKMEITTETSLVGDNIAGCTSCGDNQVSLSIDGLQRTLSGASNETTTNGGPAQSVSESVGMSSLKGVAWGQLGGTLSIK